MRRFNRLLFSTIGKYTPECMRSFRNFLVRGYIKYAGKDINIGRHAKIHKNTSIGDHSGIGFGCEINDSVTIGQKVMMGPEVVIYTRNHNTQNPDIPMCEQGMGELKPVVIEDDVWIGARVCILPGVTVGTGSVLGACTVISKDVPPYSVVVGNPGKIIKNRKEIKE